MFRVYNGIKNLINRLLNLQGCFCCEFHSFLFKHWSVFLSVFINDPKQNCPNYQSNKQSAGIDKEMSEQNPHRYGKNNHSTQGSCLDRKSTRLNSSHVRIS